MSQSNFILDPFKRISYCLERIEKELSCCICLNLIEEPWTTQCNHLFCRNCILQSFKFYHSCPLCKESISKRSCNPDENANALIMSYKKLKTAFEKESGTTHPSFGEWDPFKSKNNDGNGCIDLSQLYPCSSKPGHSKSKDDKKDRIEVLISPSNSQGMLESMKSQSSTKKRTDQHNNKNTSANLGTSLTKTSINMKRRFSLEQEPFFDALDKPQLEENEESDFYSDSTLSEFIKKKPAIFLASHLTGQQLKRLQQLAKKFGAYIVDQFDENFVTHMVTNVNAKGECKRTLKYMLCLLAGKKIVSFDYMVESARLGFATEEERFEVKGDEFYSNHVPQLSRLHQLRTHVRLFKNLNFFLYGEFSSLTLAELQQLIKTGSGNVLSELAIKRKRKNLFDVILIVDNAVNKYSERKASYFLQYQTAVSFSWVLDCISVYKLLKFDKYLVL